jgi:hypothetical protein
VWEKVYATFSAVFSSGPKHDAIIDTIAAALARRYREGKRDGVGAAITASAESDEDWDTIASRLLAESKEGEHV